MVNAILSAILLGCLPTGGETEPPRRALAKLTIALGPVECKAEGDADYKALATGSEIAANTWIRTGAKAKSAIDFSDGTELRLNENTEVLIASARNLEIKLGELFVVAVKNGQSTFELKTPFSAMTFEGGSVDTSFTYRDPNSPEAKRISKTVTRLYVLNGVVTVPSKRYTQQVPAGYTCSLVDGQLNTPDMMGDGTVSTRWIHDILLKRGQMTPEVDTRVKALVQMLGRYADKEDLSEQGYRSLGELSAPFLAECMKYPPTPQETLRRRAIARLLQDFATKVQIPDLVPVLQDPDADTRVAAAKGLERLAGTNLKFDEAYWKGDRRDAGVKAWTEWLQKNPAPKK